MKKALPILALCISLFSCNGNDSAGENQSFNDSTTEKSISMKTDTTKTLADTAQKPPQNGDLASRILGFWAYVGTDNATFVIEKKKINYPETFTSYRYSLVGDSIRINYDDYTGSFLVEMHGKDTLILTGDEKQVYYRFKK